MATDIQQHEVEWYRLRGKYPDERIKRTASEDEFVVGDWSWNRNNPDRQEYFEPVLYPPALAGNPTVDNEKRDSAIKARREAGETLESIGNSYGLTRERVRQIIAGGE
jgi:hypothetical protein